MYKVEDPQTIILFGFRTQFGGGKSTGFGLIYENVEVLKKLEPRYRQIRVSPPNRDIVTAASADEGRSALACENG